MHTRWKSWWTGFGLLIWRLCMLCSTAFCVWLCDSQILRNGVNQWTDQVQRWRLKVVSGRHLVLKYQNLDFGKLFRTIRSMSNHYIIVSPNRYGGYIHCSKRYSRVPKNPNLVPFIFVGLCAFVEPELSSAQFLFINRSWLHFGGIIIARCPTHRSGW